MKENILNLVLLRMAEGYEQQLPYYKKMYDLALQQDKCLHEEAVDTELLMDLIDQRQELIENLENTNREIAQLKEEILAALDIKEFTITKLKERIEGPGVDNLAKSIEELSLLLGKIKELDKNNELGLRRRIQETTENLSRVKKNKKAQKAYQPQLVNEDGVFIDFSK